MDFLKRYWGRIVLMFLIGAVFVYFGAYGPRLSNKEAAKVIMDSTAFKGKFPEPKSFIRSESSAIPKENLDELIMAGVVMKTGNYYFPTAKGNSSDFALRYMTDPPRNGLPPHWSMIAAIGKTPSLTVLKIRIDKKAAMASATFEVRYAPNEPIYSWCCLVSEECKTSLDNKYGAVLKRYDKRWRVEYITKYPERMK